MEIIQPNIIFILSLILLFCTIKYIMYTKNLEKCINLSTKNLKQIINILDDTIITLDKDSSSYNTLSAINKALKDSVLKPISQSNKEKKC